MFSGASSRLPDTSDPRVVSTGSSRVSHAAAAVSLAMLIVMSRGPTGSPGSAGVVSNVWFRSKVYAYERRQVARDAGALLPGDAAAVGHERHGGGIDPRTLGDERRADRPAEQAAGVQEHPPDAFPPLPFQRATEGDGLAEQRPPRDVRGQPGVRSRPVTEVFGPGPPPPGSRTAGAAPATPRP